MKLMHRASLKHLLLPFILLLLIANVKGQSFVDINAGITAVSGGSGVWGDYDNDKDLDLLITGETSGGVPVSKLLNNENGAFTDINAGLSGVENGMATWGDLDNDGDLDILITGENSQEKTFLYRNNEGVFIEENNTMEYFGAYSFASWCDYDNDGDQDLFITGNWNSALYTNDGNGVFTQTSDEFMMLSSARGSWADMDHDHDLDLLLSGDTGGGMKLYLYTNENGFFSEYELIAKGLSAGSIELGDYDSDGDLDILIMGYNDFVEPEANIYRNDGSGVFSDIYAGLAPVTLGRAAWGDYDNDGDLDLALTGKLSGCGVFTTEIYENVGNDYFNSINAGLPGAELSYIAWGDYDNDTDLDLFLSGSSYSGGPFTKIYRNDISLPNFIPEPPQNLTVEFIGSGVLLSWDDGSDIQTATEALTYNLRIGTSPQECNNVSPMAHMDDGYRKISAMGNTTLENSWWIEGLEEGLTYFWSVQTIDHTFAASGFAEEQNFTMTYTGLAESYFSLPFTVAPNPASDFITVNSLNGHSNISIYILTITGEKQMEIDAANGRKINIMDLDKGLYFMGSKANNGSGFLKLIVR